MTYNKDFEKNILNSFRRRNCYHAMAILQHAFESRNIPNYDAESLQFICNNCYKIDTYTAWVLLFINLVAFGIFSLLLLISSTNARVICAATLVLTLVVFLYSTLFLLGKYTKSKKLQELTGNYYVLVFGLYSR